MLGVVLMICDEEMSWEYGNQFTFDLSYDDATTFTWWDIATMVSTLVLLVQLAELYWFMAGMVQRRWYVTRGLYHPSPSSPFHAPLMHIPVRRAGI